MLRPALMAAALAAASPAFADADLDALRAELKAIKTTYEARIQALEARVQAAETKAAPASAPAETAQTATNQFNPDISLILLGRYAHLNNTSATRGFSLDESELMMSASIDPNFRGYFAGVLADGEVGVEEAWFQTTGLGNGLSLKGGRFRSGLGYQNEQHPHAWDFATNNLAYETLFGEAYGNDGVQLKWVAPTDLFMEFGAEAGRGANFPGTDRNKNGVGSYALFGHLGGDVGASHSWRAGVSYLHARARDRKAPLDDLNGAETLTAFSGNSQNWIADLVWKWAPNGNASEQNFKFAAEYFRRSERGSLLCTGGSCNDLEDAYRARLSGFYAQGVYQFMPRWRTGYRYDRLDSGSVDFGANNAFLPVAHANPTRHSLMLDYSPSEFSRLRLQFTKDKSIEGAADNQWFVQYIHSLGSHGAHKF